MIFSHQDVPSFVGKSCQDVPSLDRRNQWFQSHTSFSSVLMIFSHQDVPSFVGKSCQDAPSLGRKNQWPSRCPIFCWQVLSRCPIGRKNQWPSRCPIFCWQVLSRCPIFSQEKSLQNGTSYSSVLMIFSHQDVPSFVGKSCQDVPSLVRKNHFKAVQALALYS
ncbi:uncharacterized protein [Dysidea avara]|uniref:uncharacterized protein n=1 Tax=Dysidea avara TaxID=196820 RepID=UPI00331ADF1F